MLTQYFPILVFLAIAVVIGIVAIVLGTLFSTHRPDKSKLATYECGFPTFDEGRIPFNVRYYLVAILFIIFDLETAFLFPWAVSLRETGLTGLVAMGIFIVLLTLGFLYEWKKGALNWK